MIIKCQWDKARAVHVKKKLKFPVQFLRLMPVGFTFCPEGVP